jgi:hypothetical protein
MRLRLLVTASFAIPILLMGSVHLIRAAKTPLGAQPKDESGRTPVLVELFTSEGCSSCPPADALLAGFDRSQPISGAEIIVLSEHVDYWDGIGWKDPYSSHEYSERQSAYAAQFGLGTVYTPQMVVDGHFEFVGNDERRASQAIKEAAELPKAPVHLSFGSSDDDKATVLHVEAGPLPSATGTQSAGVFLAVADNSDQSPVSGGENAGRTLQHVAVLRKLTRIGTLEASAEFSRDINLGFQSKTLGNLRIVVIVQQPEAGRVLGAGLTRLLNHY